MTHFKKSVLLALLVAGVSTGAQAAGYSDSGSYNGFGATTQNAASNFSLRDPNGNLTIVDGQFVGSNYSANTGGQYASTAGGVGTGGAGAAYGQASAIGNSLNVVTVGNNNTVIVDSNQVNNGNQSANVSLTAH